MQGSRRGHPTGQPGRRGGTKEHRNPPDQTGEHKGAWIPKGRHASRREPDPRAREHRDQAPSHQGTDPDGRPADSRRLVDDGGNDVGTGRAQGRAHADAHAPAAGLYQEETGHVHHGGQQVQGHGGEHGQEQRSLGTDEGSAYLTHGDSPFRIVLGIESRQLSGDPRHLGSRRFERGPWGEPGDDQERSPMGVLLGLGFRPVRNPGLSAGWIDHGVGDHPDDLSALSVEIEGSPHGGRVRSQEPPPGRLGQHDHGTVGIISRERPSHEGRHPECLEEAGRGQNRRDLGRLSVTVEVQRDGPGGFDAGERFGLTSHDQIVGRRVEILLELPARSRERGQGVDQPVRFRECERSYEDGVHHGEQGRGEPDPHPETRGHEQSRTGARPEPPSSTPPDPSSQDSPHSRSRTGHRRPHGGTLEAEERRDKAGFVIGPCRRCIPPGERLRTRGQASLGRARYSSRSTAMGSARVARKAGM